MRLSMDLPELVPARFVDRPNRFLVHCRLDNDRQVTAFLPNPGRLWELFFPGVPLLLIPSPAARRSTQYTVVSVERDGRPIFLHTHFCNQVARQLVERQSIAELADAEIVRAEYPVGRSRFDFLLQQRRRQIYLEVKSCTLFGNRVAMFPDAVTSRGRRHLMELDSLRSRQVKTSVLFLVQTPDVDWFMPDFHTDLAFSKTLLEVRRRVQILPVAMRWYPDLSFSSQVRTLAVPWAHLRREVADRGSYLLLLRLDRDRRIEVGRLRLQSFRRGYYIYVGSAMQSLSARIARHQRRRKRFHWHIDYLRDVASNVVALPIRSSMRQECQIAAAIRQISQSGPTGFGASDCDCPSHLFWQPDDPLNNPEFHRVLQRFRMKHPKQAAGKGAGQ